MHVPDFPDMLKADLIRAHTSESPGIENLKPNDLLKGKIPAYEIFDSPGSKIY